MIGHRSFKPVALLALFFVCAAASLFAQETEVRIRAIETDIHTIDKRSELWVDIIFDLEEENTIEFTGFPTSRVVTIISEAHRQDVNLPISWLRNGFRCKFVMNDNSLIEKLTHSPGSFYLSADSDLQFQSALNTITLTVDELTSASQGQIQISFEQQQELLQSLSRNLHLYRNYFNIGFDPQAEKFSLGLDYLYSRPYGKSLSGMYFFSQGKLSTTPADTLNYFKVFPINMNLWTDDMLRHHVVARTGLEADQVFSTARVSVGVEIESIIPNLLDLSYGHNRLRLKPVIAAGINYYNELKVPDERARLNAFMFTGEIYYFIPVMEAYYLLLQGRTFYDTGRDPADAWNYQASVALGLEMKFAPATLIAKYVFGVNEITFERDDQLLIGFAMDLFFRK